MALPPRQARFVEEYLKDLNGARAAIRAGYSERAAKEQASRLLTNANVADAVARAQAERSARIGLTQDRVLEELAAIGFARLGDFAEWGPDRFALRDSESGGEDGGRLDTRPVQEIKVKETVLAKVDEGETILKREYGVKLHDKLQALDKLGKHLGMFSEKHEHTGKDGGPIEVKPNEDAMARVIEAAEQAAIKAIYGEQAVRDDGSRDA